MSRLIEKLKRREPGITLYSLTPPAQDTLPEKLDKINERRVARINSLKCDGLSLYDVQEEQSRNSQDRTFDYKPAINPLHYGDILKNSCSLPQLIYLVAGKYTAEELHSIFENNRERSFVLVGSPTRNDQVKTSLSDAYGIASAYDNPVGGVLIGERHGSGNSEAERMISKMEKGADFFISQCIYDGALYGRLLEDYSEASRRSGLEMKPVILTFSPVGTDRGLDFMKWLGVKVPSDLYGENFLPRTIDYLTETAEELIEICQKNNIPFGFNFESVINRREEVLASLKLADRLTELINNSLVKVAL